jgi:hypothetical protein
MEPQTKVLSKQFATRKEQIEKDFLKRLMRQLKAAGCPVTRKGRALIKEELRASALVGACEERQRTLNLLKLEDASQTAREVEKEVIKRGVNEVLGYE